MAIFLPGISCLICGQPINPDAERILFSPFVTNENDPLRIFHDGVFHLACVCHHPLGARALAMHENFLKETAPSNRRCSISGRLITSPDRYLSIGILTSDENDELFRFNFAQFDRTELVNWPELNMFRALLAEALTSGRIKGEGVEWLLAQLLPA